MLKSSRHTPCAVHNKWKPAEMTHWTPIQAMFYITSGTDYDLIHDLSDLMEAGTPLEGAIALLRHLVALMESRHEILKPLNKSLYRSTVLSYDLTLLYRYQYAKPLAKNKGIVITLNIHQYLYVTGVNSFVSWQGFVVPY